MWKISAGWALLCACTVASQAAAGSLFVVVRSLTITAEDGQASGVIESNETITCAIALQNAGQRTGTNITAFLLATNGITPLTPAQNYGDLPTNGAPVSRDFTFMVTAAAGRAVQARLIIQSDGVEIGRNVFDVPVGDNVTTYMRWQTIAVPGDPNASIGPAAEYPSTISVSNLNGSVAGVRNNGDGRVALTLSGSGQRAFLIDYSTNLVAWQGFGQPPATADTTTFYDSSTGPRRYYRARRTTP